MKVEPTIIEKNTVKDAFRVRFEKGLRPATIQEVYKFVKDGVVPRKWYDTGTLWYKGEFRQFMAEDMFDIDTLYEDGASLLFFGSDGYFGNLSDLDYYSSSRVLGVRDESDFRAWGELE